MVYEDFLARFCCFEAKLGYIQRNLKHHKKHEIHKTWYTWRLRIWGSLEIFGKSQNWVETWLFEIAIKKYTKAESFPVLFNFTLCFYFLPNFFSVIVGFNKSEFLSNQIVIRNIFSRVRSCILQKKPFDSQFLMHGNIIRSNMRVLFFVHYWTPSHFFYHGVTKQWLVLKRWGLTAP